MVFASKSRFPEGHQNAPVFHPWFQIEQADCFDFDRMRTEARVCRMGGVRLIPARLHVFGLHLCHKCISKSDPGVSAGVQSADLVTRGRVHVNCVQLTVTMYRDTYVCTMVFCDSLRDLGKKARHTLPEPDTHTEA